MVNLHYWVVCVRLRKIIKMLRYEDISKFVLIKNLEYAATILEHVYQTTTKYVYMRKSTIMTNLQYSVLM